MKIALVHDDFIQSGGAENLFAAIAQIWSEAPIYTSLVDWNKLPATISRNRVRPSFLQIFQKYAIARKWYKFLLPLYPIAFESFNFNDFDLVISSTTRFAKGIITKPKTLHICYINSVPRFLWSEKAKMEYLPQILRILFSPLLKWLEKWDKIASTRVDRYIANSKNVAQLVKEHYGIDSEVVYPAVDTDFFQATKGKRSNDFFLIVTRLVKWKKVEIAIKAAQVLKVNLKIVGTGPDERRLQNIAKNTSSLNYSLSDPAPYGAGESRSYHTTPRHPELVSGSTLRFRNPFGSIKSDKFGMTEGNKVSSRQARTITNDIEFLGAVSKEQLRNLYQNAKALIVTQEEDFGIAAVEAQACGLPVIAYSKGGVREIIIEGQTGLFFSDQSAISLQDAIIRASKVKWNSTACRNNTLRFSQAEFVSKLKLQVTKYAKFS
ncbi:glycosyltransferase [Candidatus Curtissbacteria bacterium]|nr:glycosyltransferase [Candidatus Curtissbacteria bacterium]